MNMPRAMIRFRVNYYPKLKKETVSDQLPHFKHFGKDLNGLMPTRLESLVSCTTHVTKTSSRAYKDPIYNIQGMASRYSYSCSARLVVEPVKDVSSTSELLTASSVFKSVRCIRLAKAPGYAIHSVFLVPIICSLFGGSCGASNPEADRCIKMQLRQENSACRYLGSRFEKDLSGHVSQRSLS